MTEEFSVIEVRNLDRDQLLALNEELLILLSAWQNATHDMLNNLTNEFLSPADVDSTSFAKTLVAIGDELTKWNQEQKSLRIQALHRIAMRIGQHRSIVH